MTLRLVEISHTYHAPTGEARQVLNVPLWMLANGEQALLRGVSGSGKTTLFNIIAGLLRPTTGEVYLDEQPIYTMTEAARDRLRAQKIGYVFQNHHLLSALTALENVIMPLAFAGIPADKRKARALDVLDAVGLSEFSAYRPHKLSAGQRLRVAIARALANRPRLLLADEPTAALDTETAASVMTLMIATCREVSAMLLVTSHDPALGEYFATTLHLRGGRLVEASAERERIPADAL